MAPTIISALLAGTFIAFLISKFLNRKMSTPSTGKPVDPFDPFDEDRDLRR